MSNLEYQNTLLKQNSLNENNNEIFAHKYNLFQQFFVVGFDPKIMYKIHTIDLKELPNELVSPKIISKYPNKDLPYINIPDSVVASHCFPKGLVKKILNYDNKDLKEKLKKTEDWIFSLDNIAEEDKTSSLKINKLYYSCYLFYENVENYKNLANHRRNTTCKSEFIVEEEKNEKILIPKVICISSFTSLFKQGKFLLHTIKKYVDNFNFELMYDKSNIYPIEKIIEGLIFNLPGLPRGNFIIKLSKETFFNEKNEENTDKTYRSYMTETNYKNNLAKDLIFEESPANKSPRSLVNYSLIMRFFRIEEIFEIVRSIILEEPILFFCEDIQNLTHTIEGILALIYPFEYPYPVVSVLPEENYSLISAFNHFIFGINCQFTEDLIKQKIINLDGKKLVVIVRIENRFTNPLNSNEKDKLKYSVISVLKANKKKPLIKLEQLKNYKIENNQNIDKNIQEKKKSPKLPIHYFGKCSKRLEPLISSKFKEAASKHKNKNLSAAEKDKIFNNEMIENFVYFFSCIFLNYQEYCVKFDKIKKCILINDSSSHTDNTSTTYIESLNEEEYNYCYERKEELDEKNNTNSLEINDIFNCAGFINATPALDRPFYEKFFQTKTFFNFIKKKIFPCSIQDKLDILYFDDKINEKLSRESKMKKIDTKFIEDDLKNMSGEIVIDSFRREINNDFKIYLSNKNNCDKGLNYFQYIMKNTIVKGENRKTLKSENEDDITQRDSTDSYNRNSNISENKEIKDKFNFYYFVFPKLLNDGVFYKKKKSGEISEDDLLENSINTFTYNSNCLYNQFEKEGQKIINSSFMINNYKNHNYSLNPLVLYKNNYHDYINRLWLQFLAKTFYSIPLSQKMNYFDIILHFLKDKYKSIDDNTLTMLFNSIYKYGDRNMNQEFFVFLRKKTYTSFLLLREKTKIRNNYLDFRFDVGNKLYFQKDKINYGKFNFIINSFCTKINEDENNKENQNNNALNNICEETFIDELSSIFDEKENFMQFECNKCLKRQTVIISCFYEKNNDLKYQINFKLISPSTILRQKWFKDSNTLDISYIRREHMECYLSTLFYFHQQGLFFDFLLPQTENEKELFIDYIDRKISYDSNNNEEKKDNEDRKSHVKVLSNTLDLGAQNVGFFESPLTRKNNLANKTHGIKKTSSNKKKTAKTVNCAEFQLNLEEKK